MIFINPLYYRQSNHGNRSDILIDPCIILSLFTYLYQVVYESKTCQIYFCFQQVILPIFQMELKDSKTLNTLFKYVDEHATDFKQILKDAVSIPSVSCYPHMREDCISMVKWTTGKLKALGIEVEECNIGHQPLPDGKTIRLPPVLLGILGKDPSKPTVCIYGHLDVQPAAKEDGWDTHPFKLTEIDGKLFGRGASDDKGPVLCWLNAITAYQANKIPLPVNLKFVFEAMEESGSEGLEELLNQRKDSFFSDVDYVCISDNYWLGTNKPCLTYGLRGLCYFFIEIQCADKDLHSGVYGGVINEGMSDMMHMLNVLVDRKGKILIPNIYDDVLPVTQEELLRYKEIEFKVDDYKKEIGSSELLHEDDKAKILMNRWRFPSLSVHGIEGCFSETGTKTVIPRKLIGKFSIRIVPDQDPAKIEQQVIKYMLEQWKKRGSNNKFKIHMTHGAKAWVTDPCHKNYEAAARATQRVYHVKPDLTREGGSIPITLTFQEITGKNVLLIPIGASDDGAHSQNEKIDVRNYIQGTKLLAAYLYEIAQIHAL